MNIREYFRTYCDVNFAEENGDVSPQENADGHGGDDADAKEMNVPTSRKRGKRCLVCGDKGARYHYNGLTCPGCHAFFRRSIKENAVYQCKNGGSCEMNVHMRRKCPDCRLKKCLSVGMQRELVTSKSQDVANGREEEKSTSAASTSKDIITDTPVTSVSGPSVAVSPSPVPISFQTEPTASLLEDFASHVKSTSPHYEKLIRLLTNLQNEYELHSDEDLRNIPMATSEVGNESDFIFGHITAVTLSVQRIEEFAKKLPGFDKLSSQDQITLLKGCSSEIMMLRTARRYDASSDSIHFVDYQAYSRDNYGEAGMGDNFDYLLRFGRQMYAMKVDNTECALLTAIVLFSERPALAEKWKVETIQEIYLDALQTYASANRGEASSGMTFAKLLSLLTELRTLGNLNSEMRFPLKLNKAKLPPFLAETWDILSQI